MVNRSIRGVSPVSAVALGCMRIAELPPKDVQRLLSAALELGINLFEHADIYGSGRSEEVFARAWKALGYSRDKILLQSKCGICSGYYDLSKEHILSSVEGILRRLDTDYLDLLLLHRPDALVEPGEVAEAFDILFSSGKIRAFGVSNHSPAQIELLRSSLQVPLVVNQMQFSAAHTGMVDCGINVNTKNDGAVMRDGGVLDYCRLHGITLQAWSPFQHGMFEGVFVGSAQFPELNRSLEEVGEVHGISPTAVAAAFILRHPAGMQLIAGTTSPARLADICTAAEVVLSRREWYRIYLAAGNPLP